MCENINNFEIGDKVKVKINNNIVFTGELLGMSSHTPTIDFWIVGIEERQTEFMKIKPEKAIVVIHTYLEKIN